LLDRRGAEAILRGRVDDERLQRGEGDDDCRDLRTDQGDEHRVEVR
jgi:hypothetical protein